MFTEYQPIYLDALVFAHEVAASRREDNHGTFSSLCFDCSNCYKFNHSKVREQHAFLTVHTSLVR